MLTFLTVTRIVGVAFLAFMALPKAATMMIWEGNILMLTLTIATGMFMVVIPFFERAVVADRCYEEGLDRGIRRGRRAERDEIVGVIPKGSIAYEVLRADEDDADPVKRRADPSTLYWNVPTSADGHHRQLVPEGAGWVLHMMAVLHGQKLYEAIEEAAEERLDHA